MCILEKKFIEVCKEHYLTLFVIVTSLFALLVRIAPLNFQSEDYNVFLSRWFDYLKENGGFKGLGTYVGDYNAPYMTIMAALTYIPVNSLYTIKAVSILFDFVLALSAGYLVAMLVNNNKKVYALVSYALVLFMPQVIVNSAMWGQSDSIYSSFVIMALILLLKEKYWQSFILLGLSFSFKLQFVFILPVFVILYVCENRFSILNFLIIPIVDIVLSLPAIIAGKSVKFLVTLYFWQAAEYPALVYKFPNIYSLMSGDYIGLKFIGIITTLMILLLLLFYFLYKEVQWNKHKIVTLALLVLVIITYTLPGMHERYLYMGEVLSIIYYLVYRRNLSVIFMMNINAVVTYFIYLTKTPTSSIIPFLAIIYGGTIVLFIKDALKYISEKSSEESANVR